jgi:hypothetical protein
MNIEDLLHWMIILQLEINFMEFKTLKLSIFKLRIKIFEKAGAEI